MLGNSKYSFWWIPKPVVGRRSTRAQKGTPTEPYRNVMYDKRVIRGSNYGATSIELETYNKAAEWRRRNVLRKKVLMRNQRNIIGTPPPVVGRRHEVIQTDKYLEELIDHPPVKTIDTQTDLFLETPPSPPYAKLDKFGVDVATSIDVDYFEPKETLSSDDYELPLIKSFIEVCIADTAHEIELEMIETCKDSQRIAQMILDSHDSIEKLEQNPTNKEPSSSIEEVIDTNDILEVIIDEIVKQRTASTEETIGFESF